MSDDDDGPCTDCGDTGITYQTERRCSCLPPMNAPSEERVMRAREVLANHIRPLNKGAAWNILEHKDDGYWRPVVAAMLAFADEGSGIGELRAKATDLINAYDEAKDTGGHYLWQVVERKADALRAASPQSS